MSKVRATPRPLATRIQTSNESGAPDTARSGSASNEARFSASPESGERDTLRGRRSALLIKHRDEGFVCAWSNQVFVQIWKASPSLSSVKAARISMREFCKQSQPLALLTVIVDGEAPQPASRNEVVAMHNECMPKLACAAYVIEQTGFRSSIMRSAVTAIGVLAKHHATPIRSFDSVGSAHLWIESMVPEIGDLVAVIDRLR